MSKIRIFCEGETERALIKALSFLGKVEKLNLWEKRLADKIRIYTPNTYFIIIFDSDVISPPRLKRFNENLTLLKKHQYPYALLQQTKNLEEELVYASKFRDQQELCDHFKAQSNSNLKTAIVKATNLNQHLLNIELDLQKLWARKIIADLKHQSDPKITCAAHLGRISQT